MDCHNRPSHTFEVPERAIDRALNAGTLPVSLPFIRKQGLELLRREYKSHDEASKTILAEIEKFYREQHPGVFAKRQNQVVKAAEALSGIYRRNVFPEMRVNWGTYPNNIGHTDFPGCFRCHDDTHKTADGARTISQDCNSCHQTLAMEEQDPKILTDLGLK
jgi:hypothetical protein